MSKLSITAMSFSSRLLSWLSSTVGRADKAGFLGAEPDEPHLVAGFDAQRGHLQRDLELRG